MLENASRVQADSNCTEGGLAETERKELIEAIVLLVRDETLSDDVRDAALKLIGWLARRRNHERPCNRGVYEARKQAMLVHGGQR